MEKIKFKYLPFMIGNFSVFIVKILLLFFSIYLLHFNKNLVFGNILGWIIFLFALSWFLSINFFFVKVFVDDKENLTIKTLLGKTKIKRDRIKEVVAYRTFIDTLQDTISLNISFHDEDEESLITLHGIKNYSSLSFIKSLNVSIPKISNKEKVNNERSLRSKHVSKHIWIIHFLKIVLLVVVFIMLSILITQQKSIINSLNEISFGLKNSNFVNEENLSGENEILFTKDDDFNFKIKDDDVEMTLSSKKQDLSVILNSVNPCDENIELSFLKNEMILFKFSIDNLSSAPVVQGMCIQPGVIESSYVERTLDVRLSYNTNSGDCIIDKIIFSAQNSVTNGSIYKEYSLV